MPMLNDLKRRYPKMFSAAVLVGVLGGIGGIAAYEKLAKADCCAPGASCCFPGSPCCNGAHKTASK
jgi:hypothetical protein